MLPNRIPKTLSLFAPVYKHCLQKSTKTDALLQKYLEKEMVGVTGIEPVTPSMSTKCSPAELHPHTISYGWPIKPAQQSALCQPASHLRGNAGRRLYLHQPAGHIKPFFGQCRSDITKPAVKLGQMPRERKTWLLSPSQSQVRLHP